ncbi:hypothetical protein C0J52_03002 [Blattella germanica]|nr:hypothetical protein C0J52_03002 [Blattella germanica]
MMISSWHIVVLIVAHCTLGKDFYETLCKYHQSRKEMDCSFLDVEALRYNFQNTETVTLNLRSSNLRDIADDAFERLVNLEYLSLADNHLESIRYKVFSSLRSLTVLNLSNNRITYIDPLLFQNVTELKKLYLEHNLIKSITHDKTFSSQSKLYYLTLKNNRLETISEDALEPLGSLVRLDLSGNPLNCECQLRTAMLWCAQKCLETGAICQAPRAVNGQSWTRIDGFCDLYGQTANVSDECTDKRCHHETISRAVDCTEIKLGKVSRGKYPLDDVRMASLSLRSTGLNQLEPDTFAEVGGELHSLDLGNNRLSYFDSGVFSALTKLTILFLDNNMLSSLSDEKLFVSQAKLDLLSLSQNQLRFISSEVLQPLKSLKTLGLDGNAFLCDCKLAPALLWCKGRNISTGAICRNNGSSWEILEHANCSSLDVIDNENHSTFVILIVTSVFAVLVVFCCLFVAVCVYRKKLRLRDSPILENVTYDDVRQSDHQYYETVMPTEHHPVPPGLPKRPTGGDHVYDDVGNVRASSIYITPMS